MHTPLRAISASVALLVSGCLGVDDGGGLDGGATNGVPNGIPGAGAGADAGGAGAGGGVSNGGSGVVGSCPAAPAGATADAVAALVATNTARLAAGSPCATMVAALNDGAVAHCAYYAANTGDCIANPHVEVDGCASFYAANFDERERKAGYTGNPDSEDMHFVGDGAAAVQGWLDSIYHRYSIIDPWALDFGYGNTDNCDTMDFGGGAGGSTPSSTIALYPYDGQTGVPTSFFGNESPEPPAPPAGWPSGYPISIFVQGEVTSAEIVRDGTADALPIEIVPKLSWQGNAVFFYTDTPLEAATTYQVTVVGRNGADFTKVWRFTTSP